MNENAIQKAESRIAAWGDRSELREIARRIQIMAPGAKRLNEGEALALAQGAVAHGLDPFNGEIWYIPGSGLMAGIKGLRKAARNQIKGNFWPEFEEITNQEERQRLQIPQGALAFRCYLRDSETIRAYSDAWAGLSEKGVPLEMIPKIIGQKPYIEGIGYFAQSEKTKMSPAQAAMKRAEAEALKRRFDLPFATAPEGGEVVDAEWTLDGSAVGGPEEPSTTPGEPDHDMSERPYPPETVLHRVEEKAAWHESKFRNASPQQQGLAIGMLNMCFAGDEHSREKRHSVQQYLTGCLTTDEVGGSYWLAILDWLEPTADSGGAYTPNPLAVKEAVAIEREFLKDMGQVEMELPADAG